jgi:CubicO group peptidase (beta-lactamase class C family)
MIRFVLAGLLLLGNTETPETTHEGLDPALVGRIETYIRSMMSQDRVPGLALAIVDRDSVLYQKGFGEACPGGPEVGPVTGFVLGSMSKSFTALAVMQLVEAGKLDLDAPVRLYLSWFRVADEAASEKITVRHLLHHTSGLPPRAPMAGDDASLEEHVRVLADADLDGEPGGRHRYSSPNYQVLGLLVEKLSGEPFGDFVEKHIFTPLGMRSSRTTWPEGEASMACGHRYWFGFPVSTRLPHESGRLPTAALISTGQDLAHYLMALLKEGQGESGAVLSPAGMEQLFAPGVEAGGYSYAMGWRNGPISGVPAIHHGGHLYHFRGKMILLPEQSRGVVVLTNASSMLGRTSSHRIANGVTSLLVGKNPHRPGLSLKWTLMGLGLVMALLTLGLVKEAFAIRKWRAGVAERLRAGGKKKTTLWASVAWGVLLPPVLMIGLPLFLSMSWPQMLRAIPDLSWWMLVYLPANFAIGLLKLHAVVTARKPTEGG